MPRALGDRQAVAHDKPLGTGVLDLHEQLAQPHAAVKRHPAVRLRLIGHGAQRVLQRIGEHGAQLGVGDRQLARELRVHLQPNAHALRLSGEGGAEQIHQLVVAVALGRDALNIRAHLADIFLRLLRLSRRQKAVDGVEMVAHIVLIDGGLHLGFVEHRDTLLRRGESLGQCRLLRLDLMLLAQISINAQQKEIEYENLQ